MIQVKFYFFNGKSEYYWIKKLSSLNAIEDYLSKKKLPFEELTTNEVKWKVI